MTHHHPRSSPPHAEGVSITESFPCPTSEGRRFYSTLSKTSGNALLLKLNKLHTRKKNGPQRATLPCGMYYPHRPQQRFIHKLRHATAKDTKACCCCIIRVGSTASSRHPILRNSQVRKQATGNKHPVAGMR